MEMVTATEIVMEGFSVKEESMVALTHNDVQLVQPNSPASLLTAIPCPFGLITHQNESGIVTLQGRPGRRITRYFVVAKANIAIPEGGTVSPISIALQSDGGILVTSRAIVTPAAAGDYFNVTAIGVIDASYCCCNRVAVINNSDIPTGGTAPAINIQNLVVVIENE